MLERTDMKISIISDLHLGFGQNTELENDCFAAFQEAIEKSLDCDLILLGGDVFDVRIPNTETFTKAIEILKKTLSTNPGARIVQGLKKDINEFPLIKEGIPVVGIAGNHERRVKGLLNPVQGLERAGFLVYLHCNSVVLEKDGKKVAVHGMSSVPDQYGEQVLSEWNPKPIEGCFNILIMHLSIAPFLYAPCLIPLEKIPKGFDLYINGHVHGTVKTEYDGKPFIIPGSLLPTQITKDLSKHSFCKVSVENSAILSVEFVSLDHQREIFYKEFLEPDSGVKEVEAYMDEIAKVKRPLKPIIKIVLSNRNIQTKEIEQLFRDSAIVRFNKKSIEEEAKQIQPKDIAERVESVNELGKRLLRESMHSEGLDSQAFETVFELLESGKIEDAENLIQSLANKKRSLRKLKAIRNRRIRANFIMSSNLSLFR